MRATLIACALLMALVSAVPVSAATGVEPIRFATANEALAARERIVRFLWAGGLPTRAPDVVEPGAVSPAYDDWPNLASATRLVIHQADTIDSVAYHFVPRNRIGRAIVNQAGHDTGALDEHNLRVAKRLVSAGFDVLNTRMVRSLLPQDDAHTFAPNTTSEKHGLAYFLEPQVVGITYLRSVYPDIPVAMTGRSGGGWTTDWVSAIDPRITAAYPCCGSLPLLLRRPEEYSDWEQRTAEVYGSNLADPRTSPMLVNYSELYALGAIGPGRQVVQIVNPDDGCCFNGDRRSGYVDNVRATVASVGLGGRYDSILDLTAPGRHELSDAAVEAIIRHQAELELWGAATPWIGTGARCLPRPAVRYMTAREDDYLRIRIAAGSGPVAAVAIESTWNAELAHPVYAGGALADVLVRRIVPPYPVEVRLLAWDDCGVWPIVVDD